MSIDGLPPPLATTSASRTWLFVPGDRLDRFEKARTSAADQVILDLEDAVVSERKKLARRDVAWWLSHGGSGWVRINALGTPWYDGDVAALARCPGLRGLILPKAEVPPALEALGRRLPTKGMIALIETALGLERAAKIAACEHVDRLAFGSIDFAADIGADECNESLLFARSTLVLASRGAEKAPPIDGVTTNLTDATIVHQAALYAKRLGFGGKLCVHPNQIAPTSQAFLPTEQEVAWARMVRAEDSKDGASASSVDGMMIDKPVHDHARRVLAQVELEVGPAARVVGP
jgi:citrate lyase subunit beta / citryl-CoA lyase